MRALRKEPEHRYSSVERLVADIRHHLANEPVQARQGNWVYYTQRFVRRHTMGVAAGVGFLVFRGCAIVMSIQRQNIAAALKQAMHDRERAEDVSQFMLEYSALRIRSLTSVASRRPASCSTRLPAISRTT